MLTRKPLIIIIVILIVILIGLFGFNWYQNNQVLTTNIENQPLDSDANNFNTPNVNVPENNTNSTTPTVNAPEVTETENTDKTFVGNGFSFTYPEKYLADSYGLWTTDAYNRHINPPEDCSVCQIPTIEVKSITSSNTLDEQILADFDLPGNTLTEMKQMIGIGYENVKIGDYNFVKIMVGDKFNVTGYYTKNGDQIVAFRVYWVESDNAELREIISTLKFVNNTSLQKLTLTHINQLFTINYPENWRLVTNEMGGLEAIKQPVDEHEIISITYIDGRYDDLARCNLAIRNWVGLTSNVVDQTASIRLVRYEGKDKFGDPEIAYVVLSGAGSSINSCNIIELEDAWADDQTLARQIISSVKLRK